MKYFTDTKLQNNTQRMSIILCAAGSMGLFLRYGVAQDFTGLSIT